MNNYYRSDGWVKTSQGPAIPGAKIYVCLQPANVTPPITPPRTLPVPWVGPNPQALIYSDAGVTPIVQPIITDGFGHYDFYTLPGLYTVVVMFGGKVQQFYIDQTVGNAGSSNPSPLVLSTNGTPNFNQTNLNFTQGAGITLATDNLGNMTISGSSITYPGNSAVFLNGTGVFSTPSRTTAIFYTIDGSGVAIGTGAKGQLNIPVNCTVTGWVLTADVAGAAVVDILRSTYGAFPTTVSIAGSDKPTLTATTQNNENLGPLSGWTSTALHAGDQLQFNVNSATTVTRLNITLNVTVP